MKKSFLIYQDWEEIFDSLTDAQVGKLIKAMLDHSRGGEVALSPRLSLLFISFRQQLDRNAENYEKKVEAYRENANKRWHRIPNDTKVSNGMPLHAVAYGKDKVKDKDKLTTGNSFKKKQLNTSYLKAVPVSPTIKHSTEDYWNAAVAASEGRK